MEYPLQREADFAPPPPPPLFILRLRKTANGYIICNNESTATGGCDDKLPPPLPIHPSLIWKAPFNLVRQIMEA